MTICQVNEAAEIIYDMVDPKVNLIFGAVIDNTLPEDTVSITIIATGFGELEPELGALNESRRTSRAAAPVTAASSEADAAPQAQEGARSVGQGVAAGRALREVDGEVDVGIEIPAFLRRRRLQGK